MHYERINSLPLRASIMTIRVQQECLYVVGGNYFEAVGIADMSAACFDVRFRGQSGHQNFTSRCLLMTRSGHCE